MAGLSPGESTVIVALGSNLGESSAKLSQACVHLEQTFGPVITSFPWLQSKAWIHPDDPATSHPDYLNGIVILDSLKQPADILADLMRIEEALGRKRSEHMPPWQPRTIDLDLIAVGTQCVQTGDLILPHPRMHLRDFVLKPLAKLMPEWTHPTMGTTVRQLLDALD